MWLRTRNAASQGKGITYAQLASALEEAGCPVCLLAARAVSRFLDGLSYEQINDPGLRERLRASRGFCNRHAWQFVEQVRDGLGTAILYGDILGTVLSSLRAALGRDRRGLWDRLLRWWPGQANRSAAFAASRLLPTGECPACGTLDRTTSTYIEALLAQLAAGTLRDLYRRSSGLCLPHLTSALSRSDNTDVLRLLGDHGGQSLESWLCGDRSGLTSSTIATALVGRRGVAPPPPDGAWLASSGDPAQAVDEHVLTGASTTGCPLCQVALAAVDRRLDRLARQVPSAVGPRDGLVRAPNGRCNEQTWALLERLPPSLATACLEALTSDTVSTLTHAQRSRRFHWPAPVSAAPGSRGGGGVRLRLLTGCCNVCETRRASERFAAVELASAPATHPSDMPDYCLPHLALLLACAKPAMDGLLVTATVHSLATLKRELDEYVRRQDYHFAGEPLGRLAGAPWRAVERVSAVRGLTGMPTKPLHTPKPGASSGGANSHDQASIG